MDRSKDEKGGPGSNKESFVRTNILDKISDKMGMNVQQANSKVSAKVPQTSLGYQPNKDEKDRFNQLLKEKQSKSTNPHLAGFIANTQQLALDAVKTSLEKAGPSQPKVLSSNA